MDAQKVVWTSVAGKHRECKLLTVRNRIKFNTIKSMYRLIYRINCKYRNASNGMMRLNTAPLFINVLPKSVMLQQSLCGNGNATWNQLFRARVGVISPE